MQNFPATIISYVAGGGRRWKIHFALPLLYLAQAFASIFTSIFERKIASERVLGWASLNGLHALHACGFRVVNEGP
jgi:hypothetical protein